MLIFLYRDVISDELNKVPPVHVVSQCSKKSKQSFKMRGIKKEIVQKLNVAFQELLLCKKLVQQQLVDL